MAQFLNFVWLVVMVGAQGGVFLLHRRGHLARGHAGYLRCSLLVGCLSVLLFPVVSSSDDLCWARQVDLNLEYAGITQTTRFGSRWDLLGEMSQPPVLLALISDRLHHEATGFVAQAYAPRLPSMFSSSTPVLRGPPALSPLA